MDYLTFNTSTSPNEEFSDTSRSTGGKLQEVKLKHIHVTSEVKVVKKNYGLEEAIYGLVVGCLYSLIACLGRNEFGLDTLTNFASTVKNYKDEFLNGITTFVDSGGYSIIKGDVSPINIDRFLGCYIAYFEYANDAYDKIFSLDIPFSLMHHELNRKELIYKYNIESMSKQLEVLERKPELLDKLYFVWHFKLKSLYGIWKQLVSELELNKVIRNRAIGGMVSLRILNREINFSPFTGIAFRCLYDYLLSGYFDSGFRLHFLGINLPYDRLHIAFLEKLFRKLAQGHEIEHTYDTINYSQGSRMNSSLSLYDFTPNNELIYYDNISEIPFELVKNIYKDEKLINEITEEIQRRINGKRLKSINSFIPLNIYSNLSLDTFFEKIIDEYEMVDVLIGSSSTSVVESKFKSINNELSEKYPSLFNKDMVVNLVENMEYTWTYCDWFLNDRSDERLDYHINRFVECIGFDEILT